jgi:hypothetical protein
LLISRPYFATAPGTATHLRRVYVCQGRNNTSIRTTTPSQGIGCSPFEAAKVEHTYLLNVVIGAILPTDHYHFCAAFTINVQANRALVRIGGRRIVSYRR